MTLNLELWRQYKDEYGNQIKVQSGGHHGHHHHHKDEKPSYNRCEDCIICKGKCSKLRYREQINNFIDELIEDNKACKQFQTEVELVKSIQQTRI